MFERYTEKARRVIFFARYEASQYGSPSIETEHLLLGLLRENKGLPQLLGQDAEQCMRQEIDARASQGEFIPTAIDLPLSREAQSGLKAAAEEADQLGHKYIGTEHILLGLLRVESSVAAKLLRDRGLNLDSTRLSLSKQQVQTWPGRGYAVCSPVHGVIEIHGHTWNTDYIHDAVARCREFPWHWQKVPWRPADIAIERASKRISFDLALAGGADFELIKSGWKKDRCAVCGWELFAAKDDPEHSLGYTNGRDWICTECYQKFFEGPDLTALRYSDLS